MSPIRNLLSGKRREELLAVIDEAREQFTLIRSLAPPLVAAYLRGVVAGLAP